MIRLDVLSSRLQEISSSGIFTEAGLDLFHNKTTVPSRIHPARGRPEGAGESRQSPRGDVRNVCSRRYPRLSRLMAQGRVELCKPEVTGSIPVRSTELVSAQTAGVT